MPNDNTPEQPQDLTLPSSIMQHRPKADYLTVCGRRVTTLSRDALLALAVWQQKQTEDAVAALDQQRRKLFR